MLRNYIKIALRNLVKHKGYSFINISGLAIGIGCCMLIFLYVKDELTFDKFQSKADRIYRINSKIDWFGTVQEMTATNAIEAKEYADRIPEVETFTRYQNTSLIIKQGDEFIKQYKAVFTDPDNFKIFDYTVVSGSLDNVLKDLNSVVITEEIALKYFNSTDVAGKALTIKLEGTIEEFYIDAVVKDFPSNSSLSSQIYFSWKKYETKTDLYTSRTWNNIGYTSILLLSENADPLQVKAKLKEVRLALNPDESQEFVRGIESILQPLTDIHLTEEANGGDGFKNTSSATYSYVLMGIGALILILACINFANLSVARSIPRAKEIGVRKVLGARRKQLAGQFLGEAFYTSFVAFIVGLILAEFLLPFFGRLTNKEFTSGITQDVQLLLGCLVLVLVSALLAGAYPAFFISRFSALKSLSGKIRVNGKQYVTKTLVLIQFTVAAVLVIGTVAMNQQISMLLNTDLGYDDENLAVINLVDNQKAAGLIANELLKNPNVLSTALNSGFGSATSVGYDDKDLFVVVSEVDTSFMSIMKIPLLSGRSVGTFPDRYIQGKDTSQNVVINEKFISELGLEGDPIGEFLTDGSDDGDKAYRVVGVMKDFIYSSAKSGISPVMLKSGTIGNTGFNQVLVKFSETYSTEIGEEITTVWRTVEPNQPVDFYYQQESNQDYYKEEVRWKTIITNSSIIAIIISCLGLFGLAHLSAQQRMKEVGVRKVLGASVKNLVLLLNMNFAKLVLLSFIVAIPIAYYFINSWLDNFANKIALNAFLFIIPAVITFGIAVTTISIQSFKAANANPVDSLRNE